MAAHDQRNALLEATERDLARIQQRVRRARKPLAGAAAIGQAVGAVLSRRKVGKHFCCTITDREAARASPVARTEPSQSAKRKKASKRNANGLPVMDFADLIRHLGTLAANTMVAPLHGEHTFTLYTRKTPLQEAAFGLLGFDPVRVQ